MGGTNRVPPPPPPLASPTSRAPPPPPAEPYPFLNEVMINKEEGKRSLMGRRYPGEDAEYDPNGYQYDNSQQYDDQQYYDNQGTGIINNFYNN